MNSNISRSNLPLVVDLDGTLIHGDMLVESVNLLMMRRPYLLGGFLIRLLGTRAQLKSWLVQCIVPDVKLLPYNADLIDWLKSQKADGRTLVLATASHLDLAKLIAGHLDIFDEVLGTDGLINLKGKNKRDLLVSKFGESGFDYVGNDFSDFIVWNSAAKAYVVSDDNKIIDYLRGIGKLCGVFRIKSGGGIKALIKALRLHQWAKNLLIFIPLLTAHVYGDSMLVGHAVLAFILFGFAASGVYLFNDLSDLEDDRRHARKQHRPFASGSLNLIIGWFLWPILLLLSLAISWAFLPIGFVLVLVAYVLLTTFYSIFLKQWVILDALILAVLYTIRLVGGAVAVNLSISFWLLLFSMFIFFSLALIKRYSELQTARENSFNGALPGRGYSSDDLELVASLGGSSGYISVLVLALYIQDPLTAQLYALPYLIWMICPIMLFWISRAWLIAHRRQMHDDPIVFALKDRVSWCVTLLILGIFLVSRWI